MDFNPVLLQQLLDEDLSTLSGEVSVFRGEALKKSLLKKYVPPSNELALRQAAFEKFLGINQSVKDFQIDSSFLESDVVMLWKGLLYKALLSADMTGPSVTLDGCLAHGKQGTGVTNGNDDTLFFTKMFNSHLTTSSDFLYQYYRMRLPRRWILAEAERSSAWLVKTVPGSVLGSVRKDRDEDRTTCKEPTLNMFYQLGAKEQFEAVLRKTLLIDVSNQPAKNQYLAKRGSIDGSFATLDLKSASDSISIRLCEHLLPPSIFRLLMQIRSPRVHVGKRLVELEMLATMGNGFTFSLMTLLFGTLVQAVYIKHGLRCRFGSDDDYAPAFTTIRHGRVDEICLTEAKLQKCNAAVFGDDIIVLSEVAEDVIAALTSAGFTVNEKKSYTTGPFRESCGGDFYRGYDVRGIYLKKVNTCVDVYSAFNRLHAWSVRHSIPLFRSLRYLLGICELRTVPFQMGTDSGHVTTLDHAVGYSFRNGSFSFEAYVPSPTTIGHCDERFTFCHGGLITFLGGYVTDNKMYVRVKSPRYIVVRKRVPWWDYIPDAGITCQELSESWTELITP